MDLNVTAYGGSHRFRGAIYLLASAVSGWAFTLLPSTRSTGGLRITLSPCLTPSRTSTCVPKSRATDDFPDVRDAVLDHGDLQAVAIEDDGVGGHQQRRCLARNVKLDRAIGPGRQRAVGIRNVDLGQQRSRAGLQRVGDPRHLAGEGAVGDLGNAHDCLDPGSQPERLVLRHIDLGADHVALHDGEHERAARRIGLHEAAHVDVALR